MKHRRGRYSRSRSSSTTLRLILILVVLLVGGASSIAYLFYLRPVFAAVQQTTGQEVPAPSLSSRTSVTTSVTPVPTPTPPSLSGTTPINVLLLGSDTDAKFAGVYDSQIMIVVSINPAQKRVSMLSVPRDLWVPIPGLGMGKIGTAYHAGGVALARETIEKNFGIPIHYYAWVGLNGFIKVIDTFGGVNVDVSHPVVDNAYPDDINTADPYAYRRLYIPAGPQHLNGSRALEYVRSRHGDLIGDFGRSARQQQVLEALREKVSGASIIGRLPALASDLKNSVRTDMTVPELIRFAAFADQIRGQPIGEYTLAPPDYSSDGTSVDGQSIVIPDWRNIRPLVDRIFGLRTTSSLSLITDLQGVSQPGVASPASTLPARQATVEVTTGARSPARQAGSTARSTTSLTAQRGAVSPLQRTTGGVGGTAPVTTGGSRVTGITPLKQGATSTSIQRGSAFTAQASPVVPLATRRPTTTAAAQPGTAGLTPGGLAGTIPASTPQAASAGR